MSASAVGDRNPAGTTAITTFLLVLASETVLFGTLLMAYLYLRTGGAAWPSASLNAERLFIPIVVLAILLASEIIAWRAWSAFTASGDLGALQRGLGLSLGSGLLFLAGQVFEFSRSGLTPGGSAFGGVFFTLMAFHALHLIAGLVLQAVNLLKARLGDFDRDHHVGLDVGFYFWTYVVAVWGVLFVALYLA